MKNRAIPFLLLLLLCLIPKANAQQACFVVIDPQTNLEGEYQGCAPFRVEVQKCSTVTANFSYWFFYPEALLQAPLNQVLTLYSDSFSTTKAVQTYSQVGTYYIAQYVNGATSLEIKKITVFDPTIKPTFNWEVCGKKLNLNFTDEVFSKYSFSPGNGAPDELITGKTFDYSFASTAGSPFTFSVKGVKPSTCNKDAVSETLTLYEDSRAPVPLQLEGIGTDTLSYKVTIGVRADEAYGFQQALGSADFSGPLATTGREEEDNSALSVVLPPLDGNGLWGSRLRTFTRKCYTGSDQILPSPQNWTIFWPRCTSENQKITVRWQGISIPGLAKFELWRTDQNGQLVQLPVDFAAGEFVDTDGLVCGSTYSYRFMTEVALPGGDALVFVSPEVLAKAISDRPADPPGNPTATVLPAGIQVGAVASPLARQYHLFRKEKTGGPFSEIGNGFSGFPILDQTAITSGKAYCYRISFDDVCGNRSLLSDSVCPVLLKIKEDNGSLSFDWTAMEGWKGPDAGIARYELIRKAAGLPDKVRDAGRDLQLEQQGQDKVAKRLIFQVRSVPVEGTLYPDESYSNEVEIIQESRLRCPDAFTPNNSGPPENEQFRCYGSFIKTYQLIVYNSWGNVVFSSDKPDAAWDGKIDGQPAQTGNYAFRAIATDEAGERLEKSGFFSLIR